MSALAQAKLQHTLKQFSKKVSNFLMNEAFSFFYTFMQVFNLELYQNIRINISLFCSVSFLSFPSFQIFLNARLPKLSEFH